ncbi:alpha/beta hydrolase-fold protein [Flocculibacter collagenilyticus]|uniref:alpha/beta hydrolase-fold protein n=1 Tax=Flocculibacter collagenilyticus TaxID=2744479 RepID=UPI0018F7C26E|nr:alpha/beta hydrolase-fold protein [Flocculibacter collagenilyticus]
MRIFIFLCTVYAVCFSNNSFSDETHDVYQAKGDLGAPSIAHFVVPSKYLDGNKEIIVSLPHSYVEAKDRQKFPVVFVMDAELMFNAIASQIHFLGLNSQMPEAIVVGIPNESGKRRDLSPAILNSNGKPYGFGGNQDKYLNFIKDEVSQLIYSQFSAAEFKILVGLSPTGQFALHSLWKEPGLFNAHIAINTANFKALGYGEHTVFDKIINTVNSNKELGGHLYISMPKNGGGRNPKILEGYDYLRKELAQSDNKQFKFKQELIDYNSYAAVIPSVMSAFNFIFPPNSWDPNYGNFFSETPGETLKNLKTYYSNLSNEYGFEAFPKGERYYNRNRIKRIGYMLLAKGRIDEAVTLFQYWVSLYPNAANAYDSLADAYQKLGDGAKEEFARNKAKEIAKSNKDFRANLF